MNLDTALIASILAEGPDALRRALSAGISPSRLDLDGGKLFELVLEYYEQYKELPTSEFVEGRTGITLESFAALDPSQALIDEANNRYLYRQLNSGIRKVQEKQEAQKPAEALTELERLVTELRSQQAGVSRVESLFRVGPEVKAFYERIKRGERGVLTQWPSVNEATLGFWPEDLVLFAARIGIGKTQVGVLLALYAWQTPDPLTKQSKRVLFVTTEISRMRIGMRFFAAKEKLPYGDLTHGRLTFIYEEKFYKAVEELLNADGLYIIGGDFDFKIESVQAAIEAAKPDFVIIDGAYLLRSAGGVSRTDKMAEVFNEIKRLAKRKQVAIAITTQFNREVKRDIEKSVQIESIALSDVGGWNADLVYGLIQTAEMREAKEMIMKPLKVREGAGEDVLCNWDFQRMDFSEKLSVGGGGGDSDEKGTNTGPLSDEGTEDVNDLPF